MTTEPTFAELLAPWTVSDLVSAMGRVPLHCAAGRTSSARRWLSRERLTSAIVAGHQMHGQRSDGFSLRALRSQPGPFPPQSPISPDEVGAALAAGDSVCCHDIHRADPSLAGMVAEAKHATNFVGRTGMSCYMSAAGHGVATHFDAQAVLTIQVEGTKTWRYSPERAIATPRANAVVDADGAVEWIGEYPGDLELPVLQSPSPQSMLEVELHPGDLLYLPAGHWHETAAGTPSIGVVFYFVPLSFAAFVERWLWSSFEANDAWFQGLPPSVVAADRPVHGLPTPVLGFVRDRVEELKAMLDRADLGDPTLARVWRRFVADSSPPTPAPATLPWNGEPVRVAAPERLTIIANAADSGWFVCFGDAEIALPSTYDALISVLLKPEPFTAKAVPALDPADFEAAVQVLIEHRVLEVASAG